MPLGISRHHPNHPNLLLRAAFILYVYFYVQLILHDLGISLPHGNGFSKVKNSCIKSAYHSIFDDYGINPDQRWMHGDWFYTTDYGIFGHEVKATEKSPPDDLA